MLIGIAGPAGSGKDTAAAYLRHIHGFYQLSFAGPLKEMMAVAGFPEPQDRALKEVVIDGFDFSWRQGAQKLGTEWGRALDPDIWIKIVRQRIREHRRAMSDSGHARVDHTVLSDVRFENEATMIRDIGGRIIHLTGRKVDLVTSTASHVSENPIDTHPGDFLLINDGTIDDLHRHLESILQSIRGAGQ